MRGYEFTLKWREKCKDEDTARDILDEIIGEIKVYNPHADITATDVQMLPREAGGDAERSTALAQEMPPHPWDQGLWIFPDDHPLHATEVAAKAHYDRKAADPQTSQYATGFKQGILEAAILTESEGEDE